MECSYYVLTVIMEINEANIIANPVCETQNVLARILSVGEKPPFQIYYILSLVVHTRVKFF